MVRISKKIEKYNHIKAQWKICRQKSEPYKHSINQCLKSIKNSPITWAKSPKLIKPKFNSSLNNFSNKKTPMKNKFSLLIKKTPKISNRKREISTFLSFSWKIIMKWKSKDWRRKFCKIGKNISQVKKILYNKLKKKWESNKEYIHKK